MPEALIPGYKFLSSDVSSQPANNHYSSPVLAGLESVSATPGLRSRLLWMPKRACQWLSHRLTREPPSAKIERRDLEAEQTAFLAQQTQEAAPTGCSAIGIALGVISVAACGTLGAALYSRWSCENENSALSPNPDATGVRESILPEAAALAGFSHAGLSPSALSPVLNDARDGIVTRFPGIRQEAVANLMIAPLLTMLSESMHGQPLDITQQQQLSHLMTMLLSTLTTPETLLLYRQEKALVDGIDILRRFIAHAGYLYVRLGSQDFLLRTMPDGTPYIVDNQGRCRFIRYNQIKMGWEYVREADNVGYSEHNQKWSEKTGRSLGKLPSGSRVIFDNTREVVNITAPGKPDSRGLFVSGHFIPIGAAGYTGKVIKTVTPQIYSVCHPAVRYRTLLYSDYGWNFERATAKMDTPLRRLLETNERCIKIAPRFPVDKISETDGLVTDEQGVKFLKKGDMYFNVEYIYDPQTQKNYLTLTDYPGSFVEYKMGAMLLKHAEDIISPLENVKVKAQLSSVAPFIIERDTVRYLHLYGFTSSAKPVNPLPFPGLSRGHDHSLIFSVNENNYDVREYSDKLIRIKHVDTPFLRQNDILLWAAGDTVLRVRQSNASITYTPLPFHYPTGSGNLPVVTETQLHQQLQVKITNNDAFTLPDKAELIEKKRFALPVLWFDSRSKNDYFYYNYRYFQAVIIDAKDRANPAGVDCLAVYDKGDFFAKNRYIDTLVIDKNNHRIEIKSLKSYLAENTHVSKDVAALYIEKFPWRHLKSIEQADEATRITGALENHYIAPIPAARVSKPRAPDAQLAARALYPHRIDGSQLTLYKISNNNIVRSPDEKALQHTIQGTIGYLKEKILTSLVQNLYFDAPAWGTVKTYLDEATGLSGNEFQSEFAVSLRKRLYRIYKRLQEDNIYLVGGNHVQLSEAEKLRGPVAFISPDDGNTYISTHKINPDDKAQLKLTSSLIEKTANATGLASPIINTRLNNGIYLPIKDAQVLMAGNLAQRKLSREQLKNLQAVSKRYLKHSPAYKRVAAQVLTPEIAAFLTRFDPAFRAHLMLNSDSLLTQLSLDIWYLLARARNISGDAWVDAYASQHAAGKATRSKPKHSDLLHLHFPHRDRGKLNRREPENTPGADKEKQPAESPESNKYSPRRHSGGSEENSGRDSVSDRETEYEDLTDSGSETSLETEYEELTDTDSAQSQETEYEDLTDSESVHSRETEYEDLSSSAENTETGREGGSDTHSGSISRSDTLSLDISPVLLTPVLPPPAVPPLHPVIPPSIPNSLPAQIVAGAALGATGLYIGAAAPEPPVIRMPLHNTTGDSTSTTAARSPQSQSTTEHSTAAVMPYKPHRKFFREPQQQSKNSKGPFFPDSRDDVFLSPEDRMGSGRGRESRVFVPGHGMVTAIELPELACLGEKEVSISQILRWAGEALQSPLTKNLEAWQELYHIDIKGMDCPSDKHVETLRNLAGPVDMAINTAMSFSKIFLPVVILQNMVGPALILAAEIIESRKNKGESVPVLIDVFQQTLELMRVELPTLKGPELTLPKQVTVKKPSPFEKRFVYTRGGKVYINVANKEYPLETTYDEVPIVKDEKGNTRIISYNHLNEKWDFSHAEGKHIKSEEQKNLKIHKISLSEMVRDVDITVDEDDVYTIKLPDNNEITGVYMGINFIPSRKIKIGKDIVVYTAGNTNPEQQMRLLVRDEYGWKFERKSVATDDYLKILLEQKDAGYEAEQIQPGPIKDDGLSYDSYGNAYMKHNYAYYRVDKHNPTAGSGEITLPDYDDAAIKLKNNYFTLQKHEYSLFTSRIKKINDNEKPFFIEESGQQFLDAYGREVNQRLHDRIGPGLYSDLARVNTIFALDKRYFKVNYYTSDEINLISFGGKSRIKFWLDDDTWLRVRDEPEEPLFDYEELTLCRRARAPGGGCQGVVIEKGLEKRLQRHVQEGMTSDRVPAYDKLRLVRQNEIPWLYQDSDTNRYYFQYADDFFNAEIIESSNKIDNPTRFPCLKLSGRSDFHHLEKNIATIVIQHVDDKIKIVDLSTFISENLNISSEEAILYLKKRPFNKLPYIKDLEELTTTLQQSDDLYVSLPPDYIEVPNTGRTFGAIRWAAQKALFPEHILRNDKYRIDIFNVKEMPFRYSPYIKDGIQAANRKIDYLKDVLLPGVIDSLNSGNHDHPIVEDYLIEAFRKDTPNFLSDVERSLSARLKIVHEELNKREVKAMAVISHPENTNPIYDKASGNLVFIHPEDPSNIYINLDLTDTGDNANTMLIKELTGAILAETLRATKATTLSFDLPRNDGVYINIENAYQYLQNKMRYVGRSQGMNSQLYESISDYVRNSPLYTPYLDKLADISMDWKTFCYLLNYDPGIRAQVALNSEDFLTLITQDLYYLTSTSERDTSILHPWVRRYGERRGVIDVLENSLTRTDLIISPDNEIELLTTSDIENLLPASIPDYKNLYRTVANKFYYKSGDNYYAAEFFGNNDKLIALGEQSDIRQVYYYDPRSGQIAPVRKPHSRVTVLKYCREADLYESTAPGFDFSEVLKFDERQGKLIPIGATRLSSLPGKVTRIEYPSFNLYHPQNAPHDIYIFGHGKSLSSKSKLPGNIYVTFYAAEGQALYPYRGNADDFLTGKIMPTEEIAAGEEMSNYIITSFSGAEVNHYHLAKRYNKNVIQLFSSSAHSTDLVEAASKIYQEGEIDLHFYTCRTEKESPTLFPDELSVDLASNEPGRYYCTEQPSARWTFDQQIEGEALKSDHSLQGFLPLAETNSYFHFETIENLIKQSLSFYFHDQPYDIFYGLATSEDAALRAPAYITKTRIQLLENIDKARSSLNKALAKLNNKNYKKTIRDYLSYAFDINNEDVLNKTAGRLKLLMARVNDFLGDSIDMGYSNFAIVSTRQQSDPDIPGLYHSLITNKNYLATLPSAFVMPGDAYRRVFVMNDSYLPGSPGEEHIDYKEMRQEHMILHEASHIAASTLDINYVKLFKSDFANNEFNVADAQRGLQQINQLLDEGNIVDNPLWRDFLPLIDKYYKPGISLDETSVRNLIQNDPMLKANLITANADSFPIFVKHIANLELAGRRKRETNDPTSDADDKHLALFFTLARDHYTHIIE
ncbi:putative adhesin [Vagococcus sp. WN89Y]|uniref:putative adhesin n=1 Tax=Vagococcus sp. WN89Y TaxID=3457258 RepID=UPI003FCE2345